MATIEKSIDVQVPLRTAYNQWTQFEEFPQFMEGVKQVEQLDETRLHWVAEIAGTQKEWDARITSRRRTRLSPGAARTASARQST